MELGLGCGVRWCDEWEGWLRGEVDRAVVLWCIVGGRVLARWLGSEISTVVGWCIVG